MRTPDATLYLDLCVWTACCGRLHHAAGPAGRSAAGAGPRAPGPRTLPRGALPLGGAAALHARRGARPGALPQFIHCGPARGLRLVLAAVWAAAGRLLGALSLLGPPPAPPRPGSLLGPGGASGPFRPLLGAAGLRAARPPAARRLRQHLPRGAPGRPAAPDPRAAPGRAPTLDSRLSILPPLRRRRPGQSSPGSGTGRGPVRSLLAALRLLCVLVYLAQATAARRQSPG